MKNKSHIAFFLLLLLTTTECQKDALNRESPNLPSENTYYQSEKDFIRASNAIYASIQKLELFGSHLQYNYDLRGDEYQPTFKTFQDANLQQLHAYTIDPTNTYVLGYWRFFYEAIYRSNILLDKIAVVNNPAFNETRKQRIIGEAKFLRGFCYYHLTNLFGDVPLFTSSEVQKKAALARTPRAEVHNLIISDWQEAATLLPTPAEWGDAERGRATKGAAHAYLGKLYLTLGRYGEARDELAKVVTSGVYNLVADYASNFDGTNENNAESVFEIQYTNLNQGDVWSGGQSNDGSRVNESNMYTFLYGPPPPLGQGWNLQPSDLLFNSYEANDPRKRATIFYIGGDNLTNLDGQFVPYTSEDYGTRKGVNPAIRVPGFGGPFSGANIVEMRYAEVLLLYAEALNETTGLAAALPYINQVRARVNMPAYPTPSFPATTQGDVFRIIMHERMVELGTEHKRWLDLVRWDNNGKIDMNEYIRNSPDPILKRPNFNKAIHKLLPIPQREIDVNPAIEQNPI